MSAEESGDGADGNDGGPGRRETAHRLFAAEFEDATYSYSESEEERAPNYVVAPSGARVNRMFAVGVLTETEPVSENVLRGRIVDPTGAFVVYAGQYQPDALAFLERTDPPAFVAVTGKARTFQPEDSDVIYSSVRPESLNEVDADTRDRWVVNAAERTHERVEAMRDAKARPERGDELEAALREEGVPEALAAGIPRALDAYGTTDDYLDALDELSRDAVRVVAGEREEAGTLDLDPDEGEDRTEAAVATGSPEEAAEAEAAETETATESVEAAETETATTETAEAEATESDESEALTTEETEPAETTATETVETEASAESEPEPASRVEEESAEREGKIGDTVGTEESAGQPSAPEPAAEPGETVEEEAAETGASEEPAAEDAAETDELYEFDEEERQQVEEEHGLEFSTGDEVESADELGDFESGLEAESEEEAGEGAEAVEETVEADETAEAEETTTAEADESAEPEPEPSAASEEAADFNDPEEAAVETMEELGGGDGVEREALVAELVSRYGVGEDEADEAIEEALMSGRCYESGDGELTPI